MTPLVFDSAGMFIDAAAALPSSVMKSRRFQLIEQHSISRGQRRIAGYRMAGISRREPEPLHNLLLQIFANDETAVRWFKENDPEGVAFVHEVQE